jgi:hypothetical protein
LPQYWNACTSVIARMPPPSTLTTTMAVTIRPPNHGGRPVIVVSVRPADCSCGTRYSTPMHTTKNVLKCRTFTDPSRASAKSGNV